MSYGSLRSNLVLNTIIDEIKALGNADFSNSFFSNSINALKQEYPLLNDDQIIEILLIIVDAYFNKQQEKTELVVTAPPSFALRTRLTSNVVSDLLDSAQRSLLITGYTISEYMDDLIDIIVNKSQRGVFVKLFINNLERQNAIDKILRYKSRFLQVYNYTNADDKMAALHAKVICMDGNDSLISSANLSYHGMSGNIELGCRVQSEQIAQKIDALFNELIFQKVFKLL